MAQVVLAATDTDGDGVDDSVDNCILIYNPDQWDSNGDGHGNECDPDINNDCIVDDADADLVEYHWFDPPVFGPGGYNPDADFNNDGLIDIYDYVYVNYYWHGPPGPGQGVCADSDGDGVLDNVDNCILAYNPSQLDVDGDGYGNRCDPDFNNDCVVYDEDIDMIIERYVSSCDEYTCGAGDSCWGDYSTCATEGMWDPLYELSYPDGSIDMGDIVVVTWNYGGIPGPSALNITCKDTDGDGISDKIDNCLNVYNPGQEDVDGDGVGDVCDICPDEDATGFDANGDGCIDTVDGLTDIIETLPDDVLSDEVKNSLVSKVENALKSIDKENDEAAINVLEAFINQIEAQRGKKISEEAADILIEYAENIIAQLQVI